MNNTVGKAWSAPCRIFGAAIGWLCRILRNWGVRASWRLGRCGGWIHGVGRWDDFKIQGWWLINQAYFTTLTGLRRLFIESPAFSHVAITKAASSRSCRLSAKSLLTPFSRTNRSTNQLIHTSSDQALCSTFGSRSWLSTLNSVVNLSNSERVHFLLGHPIPLDLGSSTSRSQVE